MLWEERIPSKGSGGQSLAATRSAGIENRPSGAGAHTGPKTVGTLTLDIAWLKSTFTHLLTPWFESMCRWIRSLFSIGGGG